ncbi:MAG: hypothetical protein U1E21_14415 [Reyranellaceae bacterium]|jgi:hypothetical protein
MMQYLGALRGTGMLVGAAGPFGRVDYELDAYLVRPAEVVASGEIRMKPEELTEAFGQRDLSLQTDDGRTLGLRFSGRRLSPASDVAHVDIRGGLPDAKEWRR